MFKPLKPTETPDAVNSICESYNTALNKEVVDELILIPCFILDFLCIHPFNDGNRKDEQTSYFAAFIPQRIGKLSKQDVLAGCPSLGSSSVESALKKLVEDGTLIRIGAGRKTQYTRADSIQ